MPTAERLAPIEAQNAVREAYQRVTGSALPSELGALPRIGAELEAIAERMTAGVAPAQWLTQAQAEELIAQTWGRARLTLDAASQALLGTVGALGVPADVAPSSYREQAVQAVVTLAPGSASFASWAALDLAGGVAAAARSIMGADDPATADIIANWTTASSLRFFESRGSAYIATSGLSPEDAALAYAVGMLIDVSVRDVKGQLGRDSAAYADALVDDAAAPGMSIEGIGGGSAYTVSVAVSGEEQIVTVSRNGALAEANLTFAFTGQAVEGSDFTTSLNGGSLSIAAGSSTATFTIRTIEDGIVEETESLGVELVSTSDGGAILRGAVLVVIEDDDTQYALAIDRDATEEAEAETIFVTVSRQGQTPTDAVVLDFAGGVAQPGTDFELLQSEVFDATTQTLYFAEGTSSLRVAVRILNDEAFEGPESLQVSLTSSANGAALPDGPATTVITDTPPPPPQYSISVEPVELFEGALSGGALSNGISRAVSFGEGRVWYGNESDGLDADVRTALMGSFSASALTIVDAAPAAFTFTVSRDVAGPAGTVLVELSPGIGGAVLDADYTVDADGIDAGGGIVSVVFADGELSRTFTATPIDDGIVEGAESFTATLRAPLPGDGTTAPGSGEATATILDDDALNEYSISTMSPATTEEGGEGLRFLVSRTESDGPATIDLRVDFPDGMDVSDLSTVQGVDQTDLAGFPNFTLTFAAGQANAMIVATFVDDTVAEPDETFELTIVDTRGTGGIATATANGTVTNDDTASGYSIAAAEPTVLEDLCDGETAFIVTRTDPTDAATATVEFQLGTPPTAADIYADYQPLAGDYVQTLAFAPGQASAVLTVLINDDDEIEPSEFIEAVLTANSEGATILDASATIEIQNDDAVSYGIGFSEEGSAPTTSQFVGEAGYYSYGGEAYVTVFRNNSFEAGSVTVRIDADANFVLGEDGRVRDPDFAIVTGTTFTVEFAAGQSQRSFSLEIEDDAEVEADEAVRFVLENPSGGASIFSPQAEVTIVDDDVDADAGPAFAIGEFSDFVGLSEGSTSGGSFQVERTGTAATEERVRLVESPVTESDVARWGDDFTVSYTLGSVTTFIDPGDEIVFGSGVTTLFFDVLAVDDDLAEGEERTSIVLEHVSGDGFVNDARDTVSVRVDDDDAAYDVVLSTAYGSERFSPEGDPHCEDNTLRFAIEREVATAGVPLPEETIRLTFAGTAEYGGDYVFDLPSNVSAVAGRTGVFDVRMAAGQTLFEGDLLIAADYDVEFSESILIIGSDASDTSAGDFENAFERFTIVDDD